MKKIVVVAFVAYCQLCFSASHAAKVIPDGEHNEASWEKQVPFFMDALFYEL